MSFSEFDALSTRAAESVLEGMQLKIVAENNWTANSLSFSSDLVRGVHARASVERRRREPTRTAYLGSLESTQEASLRSCPLPLEPKKQRSKQNKSQDGAASCPLSPG